MSPHSREVPSPPDRNGRSNQSRSRYGRRSAELSTLRECQSSPEALSEMARLSSVRQIASGAARAARLASSDAASGGSLGWSPRALPPVLDVDTVRVERNAIWPARAASAITDHALVAVCEAILCAGRLAA
jgi:hypothetical protein